MYNGNLNDSIVSDMSNFPKFEYSMNAVKQAGEKLREAITWDDQHKEEIINIFSVANSWRDSHIYPMHSLRKSVDYWRRHFDIKGFSAARPKRMISIRKKLQKSTIKLNQINDLGGCRFVLNSVDDVNKLVSICREHISHNLRKEYDYINFSKNDGYRSYHMVFDFVGKQDASIYDGRRIELQLRTRLQHSWATAVEAVGLYRGEDLKAGNGHEQWLRLFALLSFEFAHVEGQNKDTQSNRKERIQEICEINNILSADKILEDINHVTYYTKKFIKPREKYPFFLIQYKTNPNDGKKTVSVEGYSTASDGSRNLGKLEEEIERTNDNIDAVLVEANKIDNLVKMFPNYFGDVKFLTANLKLLCKGSDAVEFHMASQKVVAPKPYELPDEALLRRKYTRWTDTPKRRKK